MLRAVLVIAYLEIPNKLEQASFIQCIQVLGSHKIILVCPESLNVTFYKKLSDLHGVVLNMARFPDYHFKNIDSYNFLMLSQNFYQRFIEYEYILIYQLDAWVFRDELELWCSRNYNYIGAPWFSDDGELLSYAGNGGFSLRKTNAFLKLLSNNPVETWDFSLFFCHFSSFRTYYDHFKDILQIFRNPYAYIRHYSRNEDFLFSKMFNALTYNKSAPPKEAVFFSFERFPEHCFLLTKGMLPFGCHAFARYNPKFWENWIPCLPLPSLLPPAWAHLPAR